MPAWYRVRGSAGGHWPCGWRRASSPAARRAGWVISVGAGLGRKQSRPLVRLSWRASAVVAALGIGVSLGVAAQAPNYRLTYHLRVVERAAGETRLLASAAVSGPRETDLRLALRGRATELQSLLSTLPEPVGGDDPVVPLRAARRGPAARGLGGDHRQPRVRGGGDTSERRSDRHGQFHRIQRPGGDSPASRDRSHVVGAGRHRVQPSGHGPRSGNDRSARQLQAGPREVGLRCRAGADRGAPDRARQRARRWRGRRVPAGRSARVGRVGSRPLRPARRYRPPRGPGRRRYADGDVRLAAGALSTVLSTMARRPRLDPAIFHLPVEKMREGYYSDKYFVRTRELLLKDGHRPCVTMQVFGKAPAFLGGIDEAIAILKLCSMEWPELEVYALYDGDEIAPWETVLLIEGPYDAFAHLETLYLGVLARRTKVGTNTRRVVEAARPKQVMFFPARHDHWLVQTGDGYAAHIAGARVGLRRSRHGAPRADRRLRRRHRARLEKVRRAHGRGHGSHHPRGLRERLRRDRAQGGARAGRAALRRTDRHVGDPRGQVGDSANGHLQTDGRQPAARLERAPGARRGRVRARADRRLGWVHRRKDPAVRRARGAGGHVRRGVEPVPGPLRLHRGRRASRRKAAG